MYHKFCMTMIDGKVYSLIAESSSQKSGICGATPTMMSDFFEYGLSTLHARECIIHIAYRIPIKKLEIRDCDKNIVQQIILNIQEKLRID